MADNCVCVRDESSTGGGAGRPHGHCRFHRHLQPCAGCPSRHDIAFDRDGEVYLLSADGTTLANLTDNSSSDGDPAWSPDGQTIAFSSDRAGSRQVYLMNAEGRLRN